MELVSWVRNHSCTILTMTDAHFKHNINADYSAVPIMLTYQLISIREQFKNYVRGTNLTVLLRRN
jgi:hypothetical protein